MKQIIKGGIDGNIIFRISGEVAQRFCCADRNQKNLQAD